MGGVFLEQTNVAAMPGEYNFWCDPDAAQVVLDSGAPLRLVGLDVTRRVRLTRADADGARPRGGAFGRLAAEHTHGWIDFQERVKPREELEQGSCALHDPLAVAVVDAARPGHLARRRTSRSRPQSRVTRGVAVADLLHVGGPARCRTAGSRSTVDAEAFRELFLAADGRAAVTGAPSTSWSSGRSTATTSAGCDTLPRPGRDGAGRRGERSGSGGKGGNQAVAASLLGARTAMVARVGRRRRRSCPGRRTWPTRGSTPARWCADERPHRDGVRAGRCCRGELHRRRARRQRAARGRATPSTRTPPARPAGVVVTQAEIPDADVRGRRPTAAADCGCRAVVNLAPYRPVRRRGPRALRPARRQRVRGRRAARAGRSAGDGAARAAVAELRERRTRSVVVTVGAAGAVVGREGAVESVPASAVDVVDTTGAGDAFTGALAAALSAGCDLGEAARIGVRAGTWAVTRPGAQASFPSAADLELGPLHRRD